MRQPGEISIPHRRMELAKMVLERIFNRYATPISIGIALIGIVLVVAGPIHSAWANHPTPSTGNGLTTADKMQAGLAVLSDASALSPVELTRQLLAFTTVPDRPRKSVIGYTVKPGDTLFGIAGRFGLDPKTIFWSNAVLQDNVHLLQPGMELAIPPVDGVYYIADGSHSLQWAADNYKVDVSAILSSRFNDLADFAPTDVPTWGRKILVPGGQRPMVIPPVVVPVTDKQTGKVVQGFMPGMGGSCPARAFSGGGTGSWFKPLDSYQVTQGFYAGHTGIDLGAPIGTPVYAADSGMVIFAGWNDWGYGNLVVIDHGNGWTTYYAHLNSRAVGCGNIVTRGQNIGQVGSTGNSSGAHLHFEMRWMHNPDNPAANIGF